MASRKVLVVTYHFPPSAASGSFRLLGFARHLPKFGWQPVVVAPPQMPGEPLDPALSAQVPVGTPIEHVPFPADAPKMLRVLAGASLWLPRAWSACRRVLRTQRPDVILTSGPPQYIHIVGLLLKRATGLPWIADFRDPWITDGSAKRLTWRQLWFLFWERRVLRSADAILANAPNASRMFQTAYPGSATRVHTLTNGFDPDEFASVAPPEEGPLRLLHAGELYAGRNPLPLLDAIAAWNRNASDQRQVCLDVLGRNYLGGSGIHIDEEIRRRGLDGAVTLRGQLPYADTLRELSRAGILVLFDTPGRRIGVPAKLYEYFGARRPILALAEADGDVAAVLRASGVPHRLAPPGDAERIRTALAELVDQVRERNDTLTDESALQHFTREYLAGELAGILDGLSPTTTTAPVLAAKVRMPGGSALNGRALKTEGATP